MTEMLERVAKAIAKQRWAEERLMGLEGQLAKRVLSLDRSAARVAIAAMREPTKGMLGKGQGEIYIERNEDVLGPHTYASAAELRDAWQAMIDEALSNNA